MSTGWGSQCNEKMKPKGCKTDKHVRELEVDVTYGNECRKIAGHNKDIVKPFWVCVRNREQKGMVCSVSEFECQIDRIMSYPKCL